MPSYFQEGRLINFWVVVLFDYKNEVAKMRKLIDEKKSGEFNVAGDTGSEQNRTTVIYQISNRMNEAKS